MPQATIEDYSASIEVPQMILAPKLRGGNVVKKNNRQIKYSGGFCVVYPFENHSDKYAVRCWHVAVDDIRRRTKCIADAISSTTLPYFVKFEYVNEGIRTAHGIQPIVIMDWVNALTLKKYISKHLGDGDRLRKLAEPFKTMVSDLHKVHFAHGDLQHGNIMVKDDGSLILVDYDSMYVPSLSGASDDIKGLAGYQHPARWSNKTLSEKVDYFSELIIYSSIIGLLKFPELWTQLNLEDSETMLFSTEDLKNPDNAQIFSILEKDTETCELARKIKDELSYSSLNDLEPLEQATVDKAQELMDNLSRRWEDNGYKKPAGRDLNVLADGITRKW